MKNHVAHDLRGMCVAAALTAGLLVSTQAHAQEPDPAPLQVRVDEAPAYEVLAGLAGILIGASPMLLLALDDESEIAQAMPLLSLVTMQVGVTAGIVLAGDACGGDGGAGWTFLGQFLGALLAAGIAIPLLARIEGASDSEPNLFFAAVAIFSLPVVGGTIAYEASNDVPYRPR